MTTEEYIQLRAFARVDGTYVGILWIASFACYLGGLSSPMLGLIAGIIAILSPFFAVKRLTTFREYTSLLSSSEMKEAMKVYGITYEQMMQGVKEFADASPIMTALNIMTMNITIGIFLSLPVALVVKRGVKSGKME